MKSVHGIHSTSIPREPICAAEVPMSARRPLCLLLTSLTLAACAGDSDNETGDTAAGGDTADTASEVPFSADDIAGTWKSVACEAAVGADGSPLYLLRTGTLTATEWAMHVEVYADDACSYGLVNADLGGTHTLGAVSDTLDATRLADFARATASATALDATMAGYLDAFACGDAAWEVGVAQDVGAEGCALLGIESLSACPVEYDLVHLDGALVYLGDRGGGMCDEANRTTALSTNALQRQ